MVLAAHLVFSLTVAPPSPVPRVDAMEIYVDAPAQQIEYIALDEGGAVVGTILVSEAGGQLHIDGSFEHGYWSAIIDPNDLEHVELETDMAPEVLDLYALGVVGAAMDYAPPGVRPRAGWKDKVACAGWTGLAIWQASHANPVAIFSAGKAACKCLPLLVDEFKGMSCPEPLG
ncbi:MAG: hypothetical protein HC927_08655 [Deltaproteobacteria bacterium]|nr:hypothetical protein [Deltaproteobacteria bacterium]